MSLSRRKFFKAGILSAAFAILSLAPLKSAFAQEDLTTPSGQPQADDTQGLYDIPYEAKMERVYHFTEETFRPYIGGKFTLQDDLGTSYIATLTAVSDMRTEAQKRAGANECFSLSFSAAPQKYGLRQRTYHIEHAALGKFELFLIPARSGRQVFYVAVINHVVK